MSQFIRNLVVETPSTQIPIREVGGDVTAEQILDFVADNLNITNGAGSLRRKLTGRQLFPQETLSGAGIEDDEVLIADFSEEIGEFNIFGQSEPSDNLFGQAEFAENPEPRCPCILLLDVSGSMSGEPINQLNAGLRSFKESLMADNLASLRVEIAIITFGAGVEVIHDFKTADQFMPPTLTVSGATPMGTAINKAIDKLHERKQTYKQNGIAYYRPWIFLITDGGPTDDWQPAARRVKEEDTRKAVAFFCVGVAGANIDILSQISPRQPLKLKRLNFQDMFQWLSTSLTSTSHSSVGDSVPLQSPLGWGEI